MEISTIDLDFDQRCPECQDGSTQTYDDGKWGEEPCLSCNGTGRVPTEFGQALLDFLKQYR